MHDNEVTGAIVESSMTVHSALGPGLLESAYEACLEVELRSRGLTVRRQVPLPLAYKGVELEAGYRIDLLVDENVIAEIKAVRTTLPIHQAQLLSYLRLSQRRVGLLINFNVLHLRNGIYRLVN